MNMMQQAEEIQTEKKDGSNAVNRQVGSDGGT